MAYETLEQVELALVLAVVVFVVVEFVSAVVAVAAVVVVVVVVVPCGWLSNFGQLICSSKGYAIRMGEDTNELPE